MKKELFNLLLERYPQIGMEIREGAKATDIYKNSVLRGMPLENPVNDFSDDETDYIEVCDTPAGKAEVLFINRRDDFEKAIRKLAHQCEPTEIPLSMGASAINGLINWKKIKNHKKAYLDAGGNDWAAEFNRFTSERANFRDALIILSSGPYSAVGVDKINCLSENAGLTEEEWIKKSIIIRKFHELTHFTSQRLFPENKNAVRDEVIADAIGLVAAFGEYDRIKAKLFFGLEEEPYREGGRLQNYYFDSDPATVQKKTRKLIEDLWQFIDSHPCENCFDQLCMIEKNMIGV